MNIERIYNEVVTGCKYDFEVASKHNMEMISSDVKASDLPHIEANFMTLFAKLREQNIECYIAITKEENPNTHQKTDNHVSVCYLKNGKKYIADPVETVKTGKGEYFDIPIEQYHKEQGTIWMFDPYGEYGNELFFKGFLSHPIEILEEGE